MRRRGEAALHLRLQHAESEGLDWRKTLIEGARRAWGADELGRESRTVLLDSETKHRS